jgi:hypothetical protein
VTAPAPTGLAGMTVEERMAARGLTGQWLAAIGARDRDAMVKLLKRVALFDAAPIADAILGDPAGYGY